MFLYGFELFGNCSSSKFGEGYLIVSLLQVLGQKFHDMNQFLFPKECNKYHSQFCGQERILATLYLELRF